MLFETFTQTAGTLPGSSGIRFNGVTHSYYELAERAERLAAGLVDLGIGVGDPVAILLRNSPDMFVLTQALFAVGAISVPLDVQANPSELARSVGQLGIRAVFASPDLAGVAEQLARDAGVKLPVITTQPEGRLTLATLGQTAPGELPAVGADDVAI